MGLLDMLFGGQSQQEAPSGGRGYKETINRRRAAKGMKPHPYLNRREQTLTGRVPGSKSFQQLVGALPESKLIQMGANLRNPGGLGTANTLGYVSGEGTMATQNEALRAQQAKAKTLSNEAADLENQAAKFALNKQRQTKSRPSSGMKGPKSSKQDIQYKLTPAQQAREKARARKESMADLRSQLSLKEEFDRREQGHLMDLFKEFTGQGGRKKKTTKETIDQIVNIGGFQRKMPTTRTKVEDEDLSSLFATLFG